MYSFTLFICCWILLAIFVFIYLLYKPAPYGRHTTEMWGPMISNKWGWIIMEITVLLTLSAWLCYYRPVLSLPTLLMIGLFCLHYLNRAIVFPLRIKTKGKKMPLVIMCSAVLFNMVNGSLLGIWFSKYAAYQNTWLTDPRFVAGLFLFVAGWMINLWADNRLIHLRGQGDTGYHIPRGGLFDYISSPNLFGEIIEWSGYALLTWSLPGLAFWVWTVANLAPRALAHHTWYHKQFVDYPTQRKALVPFLW